MGRWVEKITLILSLVIYTDSWVFSIQLLEIFFFQLILLYEFIIIFEMSSVYKYIFDVTKVDIFWVEKF